MASKDTEKVSEDPEKVIASLLDELVAEVAEVCDEVDECELQEELEKLVIARSGSPLLEDTGTREAAELELRADGSSPFMITIVFKYCTHNTRAS